MAEQVVNPEPRIIQAGELEPYLRAEAEEPARVERRVARLRLLWERRVFLLRVTACGLALAAAIAFRISARYESTVRLMPPDSLSGSRISMLGALTGRMGGALETVGSEALGVASSGSLFVGILQSRTVQDELITKFDLRMRYGTRSWQSARRELTQDTDVSEDRKSGIITIKVVDKDPQQAAVLGREYVEELNRVVNDLSTSSAHRERAFLEERLKAVRRELEEAERDFSQFASKNTAIDIKEQGKAMVDAAATLQGALIAAESELEGLRQIYTDNNVRVRAVRARIAELQKQLEKIGGKGESMSSAGAAPGDSFYPSIRKLPLLGVTYADLYRRTKVQETVFETLTQEYELAKVQEAKETPSVRVLDPADVPERKSFPPRLLILFVGGCVSAACGAAWVFGESAWQKADPSDSRKAFAEEVLRTVKAKLPAISQNGSGLGGMKKRVLDRIHRRGQQS